MTHFGRQVSFQWICVGVLLLVGFLVLRWAALSEAQAQAQVDEQRRAAEEAEARAKEAKQLADKLQAVREEALRKAQAEEAARRAAPVRMSHFLERGKSYSFYGPNLISPAVVLEEPRDNWVKVRVKGEETDHWINLNTVHLITAAPQAGEKKGADKGANEPKGTVKGTVALNGKPVGRGTISFQAEKGKAVETEIKDGRYSAEGVPVGTVKVIFKGLPGQDINVDTNLNTVLKVRVKEGANVFDFSLKE
jgi:hypothetical protein